MTHSHLMCASDSKPLWLSPIPIPNWHLLCLLLVLVLRHDLDTSRHPSIEKLSLRFPRIIIGIPNTRPGKQPHSYGKIHPFFMGKSTISMVIFNSYVKLPEGKYSHDQGLTLLTLLTLFEVSPHWVPLKLPVHPRVTEWPMTTEKHSDWEAGSFSAQLIVALFF